MRFYILLIAISVFYAGDIFCQLNTVTLKSYNNIENTGCIRHIEGEYDKQNGSVKIGKGTFYSFFRGYVIFDHQDFKVENAIFKNVDLIFHLKRFDEFSSDSVQISLLKCDPRILSPENIYHSIDKGNPLIIGPLKTENEGEFVISLDEKAIKRLNSTPETPYWAFGFHYLNDSIDILSNLVIFEGNNLDDKTVPSLRIKYDLESVQSSIKGRPINYTKEIKFTNSNIKISIWDHLTVDGDVISLYLNSVPIIKNYTLQDYKKKISITLDPSQPNDLFLFAHNEGASPPNTVAIEISDGTNKQNIVLNSSLTSCEGLIIYLE